MCISLIFVCSQKLQNAPVVDDVFDTFATTTNKTSAPAAGPPSPSHTHVATPAVIQSQQINLLDFDGDSSVPPAPPAPSVNQAAPSSLVLKAGAALTPQIFQQLWATALQEVYSGRVGTMTRSMHATAELEAAFRAVNIHTMASGSLSGGPNERGFKLFLFAFEEHAQQSQPFLVQLVVNTATGDINAVLKAHTQTQAPAAINAFMELLVAVCRQF
jgi:hypothetical protein